MQIMVVDDHVDHGETLMLLLSAHGHAVERFALPHAALEALSIHRPHLVLTDYLMPMMNGLELARIASERHPQIPMIIVTGCLLLTREACVGRFGVRELIYKPYEWQHLHDAVTAVAAEAH